MAIRFDTPVVIGRSGPLARVTAEGVVSLLLSVAS